MLTAIGAGSSFAPFSFFDSFEPRVKNELKRGLPDEKKKKEHEPIDMIMQRAIDVRINFSNNFSNTIFIKT
jgi:hypothetical protein